MKFLSTRRNFLAWPVRLLPIALPLTLLGACAVPPPAEPLPPIVFVHGNGDTAGLWQTTVWRFESQGWPSDRLHAIDLPYPLARDDDTLAQPGRTSTEEHRRFLADEIDRVLRATGARQVVLMANSRGGNAVRNYIAQGGAAKVSHAILGGVPNHGVWADATLRPNGEFNGAGPFLLRLNAPQGAQGLEVTPGPRWLTVRSDNNDKYAQPDGRWSGRPGKPTNVGFDGPELKGAENVVLPGIDHRETSFGAPAFAVAYRFITGHAPSLPEIQTEAAVSLSGKVSGLGIDNRVGGGDFVNNLPLAGAVLEVWATDPASGSRRGPVLLRQTVGADGMWGPLATDSRTTLEFVITAPGFATTHIYRSPFPRSSRWVYLRAERQSDADRGAAAVVTLKRPRGYFGLPRDRIALDGVSPPADIPTGTAGVAVSRAVLKGDIDRPVVGEFNGERIVGRGWPAADNQVVTLELHW